MLWKLAVESLRGSAAAETLPSFESDSSSLLQKHKEVWPKIQGRRCPKTCESWTLVLLPNSDWPKTKVRMPRQLRTWILPHGRTQCQRLRARLNLLDAIFRTRNFLRFRLTFQSESHLKNSLRNNLADPSMLNAKKLPCPCRMRLIYKNPNLAIRYRNFSKQWSYNTASNQFTNAHANKA